MSKRILINPKRYIKNKAYLIYLDKIKGFYKMNQQDIIKYQNIRFGEVLTYAIKHVPYYNKYVYRNFLNEYKGKYIENINELPIITKETLKKENKSFWSTQKFKLATHHTTSGTSGKALKIKVFFEEKFKSVAAVNLWYQKIGIKTGWKIFVTGHMTPNIELNEKYWIDYLDKSIYISIYEINHNNISTYDYLIKKYKPKMIYGYPSSVYELSKVIASSHDIKDRVLNLDLKVITTSEVLEDYWRVSIENNLGKVHDFYGSQEGAHLVTEFSDEKMYSHPYIGIIESVDDNNHPVFGKLGNAIVTSLNKKSMPLIRYEVGDQISLKPNETGWDEVLLIGGRSEDLIKKRDGSKVSLLNYHASKDIFEYSKTQIIQRDFEIFDVYVAFDNTCDDSAKIEANNKFELQMKKRLNNPLIQINFYEVNQFELGKNGKFKSVIVKDFDC